MPRKRDAEPTPRSASLYISGTFANAWTEVIRPWCERIGATAWQQEQPSLVVVPTRGQVNALKARLVADGLSQIGLHFVSAASLRSLLEREYSTPDSRPADLRLLLALAANAGASEPNESEVLAAKAVSRSPGSLLRALERLDRAGWNFDELQMPSFVPIVARFTQLRQQCDLCLGGECERGWLDKAQQDASKFAEILITGFDAAHWSHWHLLQAAVASAHRATVLLEDPRGDLSDADLCWIGSWEEMCGEAKRAKSRTNRERDTLFSEAEMRGENTPGPRFDFLIGLNAAEQAEAIALQCIRYLTEDRCGRIGVVFAASGALPRLVAASLAGHHIPHNDGVAHVLPGIFESNEWRAWLELQRNPRLNSLVNFVNVLPDPVLLLGEDLSRPAFIDALHTAYSEVLLDDLDVLREFCAQHSSKRVAAALGRITFLPPQASLREFLDVSSTALAGLGWTQHAFELSIAGRDLAARLDTKLSRRLYLRWLEETGASLKLSRGAAGSHPYARVHLLTVADAQNQDWSHLIFGGWNQGEWPAAAASEFAREEEIRAFNRSVQKLNKRAARQGSQGEGHLCVSPGHSLYLGPIEQRAIALRQFDALIDCAASGVTIAASLVHDDAPERSWNPSECLSERYLEIRGEPLNERALKQLQRATSAWVDSAAEPIGKPGHHGELDQTLVAFNARRDVSSKSGEYDFALRTAGARPLVPELSVSDLEAMVASPAIVWMKRYLGVEAAEDLSNPWAATTGKWVHRWLAQMRDKSDKDLFVPFPSAAAIDENVCRSADERRALLKAICDSLGQIVPDWWTSGWLNARYFARHLGARLATAPGWPWITTELPVGREDKVKVAPNVELQLRGRADLVFAQEQLKEFKDAKLWVVDYKTKPSAKELKNTDLHDSLVKGTTLQLGLYALALRQLGAAAVDVSIVSLAVKGVAPQLSAADLEPHADVFGDLAEMQRTGVFGMKGEIRATFGYSPTYPLATLQVDRDILEDKWALTHPHLVLEKEEWETW